MALNDADTYVIRNDKTHTVLTVADDEHRKLFVLGWGWVDQDNQKWKLIEAVGVNKWIIKSEHEQGHLRYLCPRMEDKQPVGPNAECRLAGGKVQCVFSIEPAGDKYRILFEDAGVEWAVALVTGQNLHMIPDRDRAHDVHAHGAPIALQLRNNANDAQIWSFLTLPADPLPNQAQALPNGTYKIVNSLTGTVLDVANTVGKPVLGLVSKGGNHHEWIVTRDVGGRGRYTLKRTIDIVDLFLAPDVAEGDLPRNGTALIGHTAAAHFMVWRVPGTPIYKIFFDAHVIDTESVRGLAVNLPVVDGKPDSFNGAIVSLQAAEAQEWRFVKVPDQV